MRANVPSHLMSSNLFILMRGKVHKLWDSTYAIVFYSHIIQFY
jgi:hypothetical protein